MIRSVVATELATTTEDGKRQRARAQRGPALLPFDLLDPLPELLALELLDPFVELLDPLDPLPELLALELLDPLDPLPELLALEPLDPFVPLPEPVPNDCGRPERGLPDWPVGAKLPRPGANGGVVGTKAPDSRVPAFIMTRVQAPRVVTTTPLD